MDESELSRMLVAASADGVWLLDGDGTTLFANPRIADLLGRTPEQMVGLSVYDTLDDEGQADYAEHLRLAVAGSPGEDDHPHRHLRADGTTIWLLISWSPVHEADGSLVGFLHQCSDHTQMRRQIESLEQREQLMTDSQALTKIGSWEWDVVGDHVEWSDQLYDTLGVGRDTPTDFDHYLSRVHPADREVVRAAVATTFEGAGSFEFTARIIRGDDGRERWCHGLGSVVRDQQGNPVRVVGSSQDVTERMAAEQEVADYTRRLGLLRRVAEAANQSTSMVEALTTVTDALAETRGWWWVAALVRAEDGRQLVPIDLTADALSAEPPPDLSPSDLSLADRAWQSQQLQHQPLTVTGLGQSLVAIPVLHGGGVACVMELVCDEVPPSEASRDLIAQVATQLGRVAERERAAAELAEARDQAMEASRLKSEFLATMSHEIRTPMNGVIGLTDLLLNADLGAPERRLTEALHGAGLTLRGIINDILDLSKIEAGKLELETVDFEVRPGLQQTVGLLEGQAAEKGLQLDLSVGAEVPQFVKGDAVRWLQVLSNLGSNAIKFTDAGTVAIRVGLVGRDSARTVIEVSVTDTGPGIEAEAQQRLFEAFTQGDPSTTRRHGGTGLGLTIARQLVDALGGTLSLESEVGRGSTFGFTAVFTPASVTSGGRGAPRPAPGVRPLGAPRPRVLVVEDNEVNQMVAVGLLEHAGYDVDVAADGIEAVETLAGDHGYGAVLMDCRMPRLDGFAATRAIRANEGAGRRVPIIAMTASALAGERDRCLASGMDDFLTKPVDSLRLQHVVHQWLSGSGAGDAAASGPRSDASESTVVLDLDRVEMLHEMVKDGLSLFQRSSANFLAHAADHLSAIGGAMESEDAGYLMQAAHKLKGSALNLGLQRVGAVAYTLEEQGQTGTLVDSRVAFERLRTEVDVALAALQRERDVRA